MKTEDTILLGEAVDAMAQPNHSLQRSDDESVAGSNEPYTAKLDNQN